MFQPLKSIYNSLLIAAFSLKAGIYHCPLDPNICDQDVQVHSTGKKIDYLKVEYIGWCGSMGPYIYPCKGDVCKDGNAEFTLLGKNTYHWRNLGYPYECTFKQKL